MPNWCQTTYKIIGPDKDLQKINDILNKCDERVNPLNENDFGNLWLGDIITDLGFDYNDFCCRGEVVDWYFDDDVFVIYQSTAWCEQEGFRECIRTKFPDVDIYVFEDEPGCEVFCTNDIYKYCFPYDYRLEATDIFEDFHDLNELKSYLINNIKINTITMDDSFEELENKVIEFQVNNNNQYDYMTIRKVDRSKY